jgi:alkylation response protein AidB-like acyl-CoA dehydrogenase
MKFLARERLVMEKFLPGLDSRLAAIPLMDLEMPGNPGIEWYRAAGGAGMLIPGIHGGGGASALEAVQVTRALAVRSPSLALATTMHQFSVASLIALAESSAGLEWMLLDGVARDRRLMASGFAEGKTAQSILIPTMRARWDGKNWIVNGRKQPCSLSRSMDLLTASLILEDPEKGDRAGVALIPASCPGIRVEPFWKSTVLAGAESDTIILENVEVHPDLVFELSTELTDNRNDLQTIGFIWFELLLTACYLGTASSIVERLLVSGRGTEQERVAVAMAVEGAALMLYGVARSIDNIEEGNDSLAHSLIARFTIADMIHSAVSQAVELLGGIAFVTSPDVGYLAATTHAIGFHPPSRSSSIVGLHGWFGGNELIIK